MNTKLSMLALAVLAGMSMAAITPIMSFEGGKYVKGEVPPYGSWYTYADSANNAYAAITTGKTSMEIEAKVDKKKDTYAGAGFIWANAGAAVDLSAYKGMGVCLTYTADANFRMEFKQSNIKNDNFNGVVVKAQSEMKTVFFPFDEFAQEDWGQTSNVALDLTKQTGVNFSYKTALAGPNINMINIAAMAFGSSCVNTPPTLKTGVTSPAEEDLPEGDTLKVAFKDIFEDADGDALNIVMELTGYANDLKQAKSYSLSDVAWIMSKANPKGANTSASVTFTATDPSGESVTYTVDLNLIDSENAPVAKNHTFDMNEDETLSLNSTAGLRSGSYDADGDAVSVVSYTEPENGTLTVTLSTGAFTYTPNPNFFGKDQFTYTITDGTLEGVGTVVINVKNVNDPATIVISDSSFYVGDVVAGEEISMSAGVTVKEDFAAFDLLIPVGNFVITDPDEEGSSVALKVKSKKGLVEVGYMLTTENHLISVSPVLDANGKDVIMVYAVDGKDTVGVNIPITIESVADAPKAHNDTFTVVQDSLNKISAKKGVLINDVDPDGEGALKAVLFEDAMHGKVTLDSTGAFTYEVGDYEGPDGFTYIVVNADGLESEPAEVILDVVYKNKPPVIVAADTVGSKLLTLKEDFSAVTYSNVVVKSWFEDPDGNTAKIKYSVESPDSLVLVSISTVAVITVKPVENACGESYIDVIATDSLKASTTLRLPVVVACKNDAPTHIGNITDTVLVPRDGWREAFYIYDLFQDVDDSVLTVSVTKKNQFLAAEVENDSLIVTLAEERLALQDKVAYEMRVIATDAAGETSTAKKLIFMVGQKVGIPQMAAAPKASWQNAILADQGVAAMCDMQGRVMWKAKLPVSEDAVRNAAAKVQGRKVLMVNKQTWTIK